MGYHTTFTGFITVTPALTDSERQWVASLREHRDDEHLGRPGWFSPWFVDTEGRLVVPTDYDKPRQAPEWLVWIMQELDDPLFSDREPSGATHDFSGTVIAQGACGGDRYELRVADGAVSVHRSGLPCWSCWWSTLLGVPPSAAYAFDHPDQAENPDVAEELRDRQEAACLAGAWTPGQSQRAIVWPPAFTGWWHEHVTERADAYWQRRWPATSASPGGQG